MPWEARIYKRLSAMPEEAGSGHATRLVAALAVGSQLIRLRRLAGLFGDAVHAGVL